MMSGEILTSLLHRKPLLPLNPKPVSPVDDASAETSIEAVEAIESLDEIESSKGSRRRQRYSANSAVLTAAYARIKNTLFEQKCAISVRTMGVSDRGPDWHVIVLAGLWRIDHHAATGRIEIGEWDLLHARWEAIDEWPEDAPALNVLPGSNDVANVCRKTAFAKLWITWGPLSMTTWSLYIEEQCHKAGVPWPPTPDLNTPESQKAWLDTVRRTFYKNGRWSHGLKPCDLKPCWRVMPEQDLPMNWQIFNVVQQAEKALRNLTRVMQRVLAEWFFVKICPAIDARSSGSLAANKAWWDVLWNRWIQKDLLSIVAQVRLRQPVPWSAYVQAARHEVALRQVAKEHPNLLPLLNHIRPKYWGRPNLFSRRRWVRDGRHEMVIETSLFSPLKTKTSEGFTAFERAGGFRWMMKASSLVIRRWLSEHRGDAQVIERCMRLNLPPSTSPLLWEAIVRLHPTTEDLKNRLDRTPYQWDDAKTSESLDRLLRAFAVHAQDLWNTQGLRAAMKSWAIQRARFKSEIFDWWLMDGLPRGLPAKGMTWSGIQNAAERWHQRQQTVRAWFQNDDAYEWFSAWGPAEVMGNVRVTPLLSSLELWHEGRALHHCVGTSGYDREAVDGRLQLFRLEVVAGPHLGERSTLCLKKSKTTTWSVDQNLTYCNHDASPVLQKAGLAVARSLGLREVIWDEEGKPRPKVKRSRRDEVPWDAL